MNEPKDLSPERAEEVAAHIAEEWHKDWGQVCRLVSEKTGLPLKDAFQFMLLREFAMVRGYFEQHVSIVESNSIFPQRANEG